MGGARLVRRRLESVAGYGRGMDRLVDVRNLTDELRAFARERDWEQFHGPKNLALALTGEVGELCAELQWLTDEEASADGLTTARRSAIADELADVTIYLVRLSDRLGIDLADAVDTKMASNRRRYPPETSRGSAAKAPPER